ncbi:protein phosphatase 1 regulatory subunit 1C-like isoform X3 [Polyodon spathula]|uniref:protein phosphatase 1 regulatory subunit 1C-like isoform X3 n=1 Tax=Polyodon spathula TaxID=7913 RepID=UPI001B7F2957|nr:protein phosphatase 1 regulatory subunit 1C-like isoform X3 [Polyodon spathula]
MEPNSPKKIQFAVPLFQSQLDPQAAEQIRRRRPTPATLVIFSDQSPPEADEQRTANSQGQAKSAEMSPKQRKQSVYNPPTMKGVKLMKSQQETAFPEEEEGVNDKQEDRTP